MRRASFAVVALAACHGGGGAGPTEAIVAPVSVPAPSTAPAIDETPAPNMRFEMAFGLRLVCVRVDRRVFCAEGLDPERSIASGTPIVDGAISLAVGHAFACAAMADGTVRCWGANEKGQVGGGSRERVVKDALTVQGAAHARKVLAGETHACAVTDSGAVLCWGNNDLGQTAASARWSEEVNDLVEASPVPGVDSVATALLVAQTSCSWRRDGGALCWGFVPFARGDDRQKDTPTRVPLLDGFAELAAADTVSCGVKDAAVSCWGESYSLFGDFRGAADRPRPIALPARVRKVAVGEHHACALAYDGSVHCWGSDVAAMGREDDDKNGMVGTRKVDGLPRARDLWAGGEVACALGEGRELWCWGRWVTRDRQWRVEPKPILVPVE